MKRLLSPRSPLVPVVALALLVACGPSGMAADPVPAPAVDAKSPQTGFVAYYFHGNFRCKTCLTIERLAHETIAAELADDLASGRLAWRAVNVDEPANEHFVEDFKLTTRSLVLVSYQDGKVVRHQNLDKVWQLVHDEPAFQEYVRDSTVEFLGQS